MKNMIHDHRRVAGNSPRLFAVVSGVVAIMIATTCSQTSAGDVFQTDLPTEFTETSEQGLLFLNGEFLSGPYRIEGTIDSVAVNGIRLPASALTMRDSGRRGGGGRGDRGRGSRGQGRSAESAEQERGASGNRRGQFPSIRAARLCAASLHDDCIVVVFDDQPLRVLSHIAGEYEFCESMLAESPARDQVEQFVQYGGTSAGREIWRAWLQDFTPDSELRVLMQERIDAADTVEAQNFSDIAASARLEQFAYPLTIAGMLLGVIAFGHMLKWMSRGFDQPDGRASESERFVVVALCLMMGMSVIDLIWTILAGQAGAMTELNPLAAQFIDSPIQLACFKVFATAIGFGILFAWRQRRQVQQATWWMCLVCVLLTFRWVMFDSMMN
ncbi:MAG: DUF5658 family protein [Fuerstiella sp.]|jgi:hypothetical protein|nr:DUF5658 family protein [Fuerstiella sp.]